MSEENVAIVRRIYEAFPRAFGLVRAERFEEWEAMPEWELYDPEVVLEEVAELPDTTPTRASKASGAGLGREPRRSTTSAGSLGRSAPMGRTSWSMSMAAFAGPEVASRRNWT